MHTDRAINQLQLFIMAHRDAIQDVDSDRPMTFYGLRHSYAVAAIHSGDDIKTV